MKANTTLQHYIYFVLLLFICIFYHRTLISYSIKNNKVKAVATAAFQCKRLAGRAVVATYLTSN